MTSFGRSGMKAGAVVSLAVRVAMLAVLGFAGDARAGAPTYTTIDVPGAIGTIATSINAGGAIVGDFCVTGCTPHEQVHGYVLSQGTFTEIDFPGAKFTRPLGINDDGDIVGYYRVEPNNQDHGFLLSGGAVTSIDVPGASQTHAIGIDAAGEIFGGYCHGGNECYMPGRGVHGFLLAAGVFTPLDFPGAVFTEAWGRDRAGRIAGRYQDAGGLFHAFLLSSGTFSSVDFPGAAETAPGWYALAGGMAASGDLASSYCAVEPCLDPSPNVHGFVLKEGRFTSFDPPGSLFTDALGMNPTGAVVGAYLGPDGHYHGFLRTP